MATTPTPDPIHLNPKNKGLLHKTLGIPVGEKIPVAKLQEAARSSDETVRKRAQFALNARKFNHADPHTASKDAFREKFLRGDLDTGDTDHG